MNSHLLLAALRARYRIFLFVLGVTVLAATVVSLLLPKTYVASVAMLVDNKAEQSMGNSMSYSTDSPVRERVSYMQTQVDIITSQKVAHKVISDLGLTARPELRSALRVDFDGENSIEDRLAEILLLRLKVPTSQSSVINISFPSSDPDFSALIANAFAKAYMDTSLELHVEPSRQTAAWFDDQIKTLRGNLDQALASLMDYQKEKGVVTPDEQNLDAGNIVSSQVTPGHSYVKDARQQQMLMRLRSPNGQEYLVENYASSHSRRVREDLLHAEAKLRELGVQLGSNHPTYQTQLSETQSLRAELSRTADLSSRQSQRRETVLRDAMTAQQARVSELRQYRNQVSVLTRDVDIAQKAYETAMQHAVDKKVESRASLSKVSILNAATVPFKPARPNIALNIALSLIVGALLGLCVIYLMEMFDRRVRSSDDLENEWHVPVLAELNAWQPGQGRLPGRSGVEFMLPNPG